MKTIQVISQGILRPTKRPLTSATLLVVVASETLPIHKMALRRASLSNLVASPRHASTALATAQVSTCAWTAQADHKGDYISTTRFVSRSTVNSNQTGCPSGLEGHQQQSTSAALLQEHIRTTPRASLQTTSFVQLLLDSIEHRRCLLSRLRTY